MIRTPPARLRRAKTCVSVTDDVPATEHPLEAGPAPAVERREVDILERLHELDPAAGAPVLDCLPLPLRARIDWAPREPNHHVFSLDVESASYVRFGDDPTILVWDGVRGLRSMPFPDVE